MDELTFFTHRFGPRFRDRHLSPLAPKGHNKSAQGIALGKGHDAEILALKGHNKDRRHPLLCPFRAIRFGAVAIPRALPWAGLLRPLQGQFNSV